MQFAQDSSLRTESIGLLITAFKTIHMLNKSHTAVITGVVLFKAKIILKFRIVGMSHKLH